MVVKSDSELLRNVSLDLLREILRRLDGQHFFIVEYGPKTKVLEHKFDTSLAGAKFTKHELDEAAKDLVLQIREGSYEKFVDLPLSAAHDLRGNVKDNATKMSLQWLSGFDYRDGKSGISFTIGVEK